LDDEHLFIRSRAGYIKFHKFEIGSVTYRAGDDESNASGSGTEKFLVEPGRVTFLNAIKSVRRKVKNGEKLGYILLQLVGNPNSGVDWSLAYDSLPKHKRAPSS
jgi:hypothetical protein